MINTATPQRLPQEPPIIPRSEAERSAASLKHSHWTPEQMDAYIAAQTAKRPKYVKPFIIPKRKGKGA